MQDELLEPLKQRGMSEKEAKIYLCVLELGSAPASTIARKASIKRVTTYAILRDMETRQTVSSIEKSWITYFQVVEPTKLLAKLKQQHDSFAEKVPDLMALVHSFTNKPRVQYFKGISGVKEMYDDMLTSQTDILAFVWLDEMDPKLSEHLFATHVKKRAELGILAKVIVSWSEKNKTYQWQDEEQLRKTVCIDNPLFNMANEIDIYGPNKIAISLYSREEMSGIIIHSKKLYDSVSSIFNLLWEQYSS